MNCKFCKHPEGCAFQLGVFSPDNYRCGLMSLIRRCGCDVLEGSRLERALHGEDQWHQVIDLTYLSCSLRKWPKTSADPLMVILSGYKHRGKVDLFLIVPEDGKAPYRPTLEEAQIIADFLENERGLAQTKGKTE